MARRKTVPISRKPAAAELPATETAPPEVLPAGLEAVTEAARRHPKARRGPVGRTVYGAVFGISYGVVFTALLLGRLIPGGRLVGEGIRDGADAAKRDLGQGRQARAGAELAA